MKYVFLLNMGGVNQIDECEVFLKNMFNDPNILGIKSDFLRSLVAFMIRKFRIKSMKENYNKIGGKSPLTKIQKSLCDKLNSLQKDFHFDFISTYVPPFAKEVLAKYDFKDNDEIILFPLYPHHSITTTTSSLQDFYKNFDKKISIKEIPYFYQDELYNNIILNEIQKYKNIDCLIISAHSLPIKTIEKGDIYEEHIKEHFAILKDKLQNDFKEIKLAYQSKLGPVKWLEPALSDELDKLGNKSVLIYPLSFCIDCSETILELDIEYRHQYKGDYNVCKCPNDSEDFAKYILSKLEFSNTNLNYESQNKI